MPRLLLILVALVLLTGCSGWVEHQQITVTRTPATFDLSRTIQSIGYRPVSVSENTQPPPSIQTIYRRPHTPQLTADTFRDRSIILLIRDSGTLPFARPTGLNQPVAELLTALRADGVHPDHIHTSATYSPPGLIQR